MHWFEKIRRRREELGISQGELAFDTKISQTAIAKIEGGRVNKSKFLPRIAKRLGLSLAELDEDFMEWSQPSTANTGIQEFGPRLLGDAEVIDPAGDTPLLATYERPDGAILVFTNPIGSIKRPSYLTRFKKLQALLVNGNLMSPEIESGDVIFGTPELPPAADTTCMFYSQTGNRLEATEFGMLRRLSNLNDTAFNVKTWRSSRREDDEEILASDRWRYAMRIVAKYYGRFESYGPDMGHILRD